MVLRQTGCPPNGSSVHGCARMCWYVGMWEVRIRPLLCVHCTRVPPFALFCVRCVSARPARRRTHPRNRPFGGLDGARTYPSRRRVAPLAVWWGLPWGASRSGGCAGLCRWSGRAAACGAGASRSGLAAAAKCGWGWGLAPPCPAERGIFLASIGSLSLDRHDAAPDPGRPGGRARRGGPGRRGAAVGQRRAPGRPGGRAYSSLATRRTVSAS